MSLFQIIDNKYEWGNLLKGFTEVDIYYSYEYGNLFAEKENGSLFSAYFESEDTKIFYPFIQRTVDWDEEAHFDIVTPYGYGGPLLEGRTELINYFYQHFGDYCKKNNIVTETVRFHPFIKNHDICKNVMEVEYIRKTTAVDLTLPLEEIRKSYSSMNKRNIKKAQSLGVSCFLAENTSQNIDIFMKLYKETMDRNNADSYYYFDKKYFLEQVKNTNVSETFLLFAQYSGKIIASVMVIKGQKYSHYHLGASKTEYLHLKPNNLLFDFMIDFCKSKGSLLLHLGGGNKENDNLFKFKTSFTNNNLYDFFLGRMVYDLNIYNKLIKEIRNRYKVNETYFPIYRGKKELLNSPIEKEPLENKMMRKNI